MAMSPSICGVILAAGFSTRMGRDKALLPWPPVAEGTPAANTFLGATIDLLQPMTDLVIVVAGKNAAASRAGDLRARRVSGGESQLPSWGSSVLCGWECGRC